MGVRARGEWLWVALGQGSSVVFGMVALKGLTTLLGPEEYGRFALGLSVAGLLNLFLYGPLGQAVSRYFHVGVDSGRMTEFFTTKSQWLRRSAWTVLALGGVALSALLLLGRADWGLITVMSLGYGLCAGTLSVDLADYNTRRQRRGYALLQSGDALLRLLLAVVAVYFFEASAAWALAGFLCGSLILATLARRGLNRLQDHSTAGLDARDVSIGSSFTRYAASFSLLALPAAAAAYGDRWLIQQMLTAADVGVYVAIAQIANAPANLVQAVFSQTLAPILFQRAGNAHSPDAVEASRTVLYRSVWLLMALLAIMVIISYLFDRRIVGLLTSVEFVSHARLLWLLVLAAAIFQLAQALASEAFVFNRPFLLFYPKMAHAMIFLGLSVWLAGVFRLEGVAIAAVVAAFFYLFFVVTANRYAVRRYLASPTGMN